MPAADQGRGDVARAAEELAERLPSALAPLARLAYNYRWSWLLGGPDLFRAVDAERFDACAQNPVRMLQEASMGVLARAAADRELVERAAAMHARVVAELGGAPDSSAIDPARPVAFFCAEYGVHVSLPVYSGGLGALAGDLLKEASDRRLPMVAVGLMYGKGYFRQRIDAGGWQHEYWLDTDPPRLPGALVSAGDGSPLTVSLPIGEAEVTARIWRIDVGRVPLFLLDADIPANGPLERWITGRLYEGDGDIRLAQYALLGIGGVRALRALGIDPGVIHLNEGHAAFAPIELAADGAGDLEHARLRTVFTTHTPVPAGNDAYPASQVALVLDAVASDLGTTADLLIELGRTHPSDLEEPFGMTQAALRLSRAANGVSARHGRVAREMWHELWPDEAVETVPIGHVTNGVHVPTWIGEADALAARPHARGRLAGGHATRPPSGPPSMRCPTRICGRRGESSEPSSSSSSGRAAPPTGSPRGDSREYVESAARAFDPDVLTLGFARRVATYKRLELLTRDPEWTLSLLGGERPVQVVLAGKAHPRDDEAKRTLQSLFAMKGSPLVGSQVVFLDDYDLATGARLVRGCDVWMNLPRPPLEASGTSGMKSAFNGGLQLSVLDGWWAEAYDGGNGWALPGEVEDDPHMQDARDAEIFHRLLADEVVPAFYDRDERGRPASGGSR